MVINNSNIYKKKVQHLFNNWYNCHKNNTRINRAKLDKVEDTHLLYVYFDLPLFQIGSGVNDDESAEDIS